MRYGSFRMKGRGKKEKIGKHRPIGFLKGILFLIALLVLIVIVLNFHFYPTIVTIANAEMTNRINKLVNSAVNEYMLINELSYSDYIKLSYNSEGDVVSLEANTVKLNVTCSQILDLMLEKIKTMQIVEEKIPLGAIFGTNLDSTLGPELTVKIQLSQSVSGCIESKFEERGLNQTHHKIVFSIEVRGSAIMPNGRKKIKIATYIPLAETIIVGRVPDSFTNIVRLTDDMESGISDSEIDDIIDFKSD